MDLRAFYQKIRQIEATITGDFAVMVSLQTTDGGKAGVMSEVARETAARLIVEQRARLATAEEAAAHRKQLEESGRRASQEQMANRMQIAVLADSELRQLQQRLRPPKS